MSPRRIAFLIAGVIFAAFGAVVVIVGLDDADKISSVVGAATGLLGLALTVVSLLRTRPAATKAPGAGMVASRTGAIRQSGTGRQVANTGIIVAGGTTGALRAEDTGEIEHGDGQANTGIVKL